MDYLFVGGPCDGQRFPVPDGELEHTVRARRPVGAVAYTLDPGVDDDPPLVTYRRRGYGQHVAYWAPGKRHDAIHWAAEAMADHGRDLRRVEGTPYCWTWSTGEPARIGTVRQVYILGDGIDDYRWVEHQLSPLTYHDIGDPVFEQDVAVFLLDELDYQRLPACFVDGCDAKAQGGAVNGLWKPQRQGELWEMLGPVRACPPHFTELLKLPPSFGPLAGVSESVIPGWLRPYVREHALGAFDRAFDMITTPEREYAVTLRYRHLITGAWVDSAQYWGMG